MILVEILEAHNATVKSYAKDATIFTEGSAAQFYFQIKSGKVKAYNLTEDGKEFTQGFFESGNS